MLACLLLGLAGCSTPPRYPVEHAVNWDVSEGHAAPLAVQTVTEGPRVAVLRETNNAAPPPKASAAMWIPLSRWAREQGAGSVVRLNNAPTPIFALNGSNGVLTIQTGSLSAKWDGLDFRLGFEPQLIGGEPFVNALDLQKNLQPLSRNAAASLRDHPVVVIDPGHGGLKAGTRSVLDGTDEKVFTLDVAKRLELLLAAKGFRVFLTRTNDTDVSLSNRVAFAEALKADLFISLHFNSAADDERQAGIETFCLTPSGMASTLTRGYEDDASLVFPNNAFDSDNLRWAVSLHRALVHDGALVDRGVRRARFLTVLQGQNRPAVLIEAGYLSNPKEARRIGDGDYRQKLAQAMANALAAGSESKFSGPGGVSPDIIPGLQNTNAAISGATGSY